MSKDIKAKMAKWLYEKGKEWIDKSSVHHLDRTAKIFVELIDELDEPLAQKLYRYYSR